MSVLRTIINREICGRGKAFVRNREVPLGTILDYRSELTRCILLGFSNNGEYLISYSFKIFFEELSESCYSQAIYKLQLWKFHGENKPVTLSMEFSLFEDVIVTSDIGLKMTTVQFDDNILVVHGSNSMKNKKQSEAQDCYVSVIWLQEKKCLNFAYKAYYPWPTFDPTTCILPPRIILLNSGTSIECIEFCQSPSISERKSKPPICKLWTSNNLNASFDSLLFSDNSDNLLRIYNSWSPEDFLRKLMKRKDVTRTWALVDYLLNFMHMVPRQFKLVFLLTGVLSHVSTGKMSHITLFLAMDVRSGSVSALHEVSSEIPSADRLVLQLSLLTLMKKLTLPSKNSIYVNNMHTLSNLNMFTTGVSLNKISFGPYEIVL